MPTKPTLRTHPFPETARFVFAPGLTMPTLLLKPSRVGVYRFALNFLLEIVSRSCDLIQWLLIQNHHQFPLKQHF
jgi:hypothetical protein